MSNLITNIVSPNFYIPHGHCYLWQTPLVLLHLISDLLIAVAYFSIPIMLLYFVFKRSDVPFQGFFVMFGAFIIFCGTGHLLEIWTIWHPAYWLSGIEQALTAIISCYTAVNMARLLPRFLSLKTPEQLERVNQELQKEIVERQKAETELRRINEELETRVQERTAQLQQSAEQKQTITRIVQRMRQTLDLQQIFAHTTEELRAAINCERTLVYQFNPDWSGHIVAESVAQGWSNLISQVDNKVLTQVAIDQDNCVFKTIEDTYLQESQGKIFGDTRENLGRVSRQNSYRAVADVYEANLDACYLELLEQLQAKAYLVVPIIFSDRQEAGDKKNRLWGLLFAYQLSAPRQWKSGVIEIMMQIGTQLGVAVQQGELLARTQQQARELEVAKNEAEKANHFKSEFLANMSHELRTPLNAVLGYTQLMQRSAELSAADQEYINIIDSSGRHLLSLINDVLEMSKIEAGQAFFNQIDFDLYSLLAELEKLFQLKAQYKQLQLSFQRHSDVPQYIKTDRKKLRQVLINILGNAIKFTEQGQVKLEVGVKQSMLYFTIQDTGLGIAPEELNRIFVAFGQAQAGQQSNEGTGLGLSISNVFIELMRGKITVSSKVNQGTTFTFTIPLVSATSILADQSPTSSAIPIALVPNQPEFRILVAEDRLTNRQLMVKILTSVGFKVKEAVNGQEAITIWQSWQPQLIWMDMQMPVMNGFEASQEIKASLQGQATVIIALTASVFEEDRQKIITYGCDDVVSKPFRTEELFNKMAQYLGVQYVYQEAEQVPKSEQVTSKATNFNIDAESLKVMPPEWIKQINQRGAEGNYLALQELIEEIPPEKIELKTALAKLIDDFQFEAILDCVNNP
ncbi:Two-component hybrid sensor and regulator [Hyella patelloides LEGE 07179]|uniref:Circadian input-output histidine kinase CikA n=1 Tax=Hyella patelloides LEGE 07179 TaxID=945734 RepID=A0A563VXP4_9CYAN|nr:GAF domain-containing hybrid sensor histidine kinase/response regulator [Hyella patelloides]VEP16224.1 Two-component hybrid sensor and regulator [Hyella patelloides LEGE 07179]